MIEPDTIVSRYWPKKVTAEEKVMVKKDADTSVQHEDAYSHPSTVVSSQRVVWCLLALTIYLISVYGRWLEQKLGFDIYPAYVAILVFFLLVVVFFYCVHQYRKNNTSILKLFFFLCVLLGGGVAVALGFIKYIEVVHFLLFFAFGYQTIRSFPRRYAVVLLLAVAVSDEILQYFLPDRVGDLQDVMINSLFGVTGVLMGGRRS